MKNSHESYVVNKRYFGIAKERDYIVENLSTLIASGVGVYDALDSIQQELHSKLLKKIVSEMMTKVSNGLPLWRTLAESGIFSESVVSLVKIGEDTGQLTENLLVVAKRNRKNREFSSKLSTAMMYPLFVLVLTFIVGTGIAWFILPKLATVFGQLNVELPWLTRIVIDLGVLLQNHGIIVVPLFVIFITLLLLILFVFPKTKHLGQSLLLYVPGIGKLITQVEVARFSYLLGTLLEAGIPISDALHSIKASTPTRRYEKFYKHLFSEVVKGQSIRKVFSSYKKVKKLFPGPVRQMLVTAEQSGSLSRVLIDISDAYEEKIESTTKNVSVLLEPILLVIVWLGVVGIALAVILPIYGILGGVR